MDIFAKRLCTALKKKNMRPADLAEVTGIGKSAISQYMSGAFRPKQVRTEKIADALGVSVAYLMGYENEKNDIEYDNDPSLSFPIIGEVAAGYSGLAAEEETGDYEQIPISWLRGRKPDEFFVLRVKGDSMYPRFIEGDHVLVLRTTTVDSGTIAVVLYDSDAATLKRVNYVYGEDWMELEPLNPEYAPKRIEGENLELCRVLGEVWRLIRIVKE